MSKWDLTSQLYYDRDWHDAPLYVRDLVTIDRGRANETPDVTPSASKSTLSNRDNKYSPKNAAAELFGKIGQNTPMRHHFGTPNLVGAASFDVDTETDQVAPSVDAPAAGLLICAWAAPSSSSNGYTVPASMTEATSGASDAGHLIIQGAREVISAEGATGTRTATTDFADEYVAASVFIQGPTDITTGSLVEAGTSWSLDVVDPGDVWVVISVFASAAAGDPPPYAPAYPSDTDGGGWVLLADSGAVNWDDDTAPWGRVKAWAKLGRTVNDSHTITLPGADDDNTLSFVARVPADEVTGSWDIRHMGEIGSWKPDRTIDFDQSTGKGDAWTKVSADGVLRRLGQGNPPSRSAMRRTIEATNPLGYWAFEDGFAAGQAASVVAGQPAMSLSGTTPEFNPVDDFQDQGDITRFGTAALADLSNGASLRAEVNLASRTSAAWTVGIGAGGVGPANRTEDLDLLAWATPGGTYVEWRLRYVADATHSEVIGIDSSGAETVLIERIGINLDFGARYVSAHQDGTDVVVDLYESAGKVADETFTISSATLTGIRGTISVNAPGTTTTEKLPVGHLAIWPTSAPPAVLAAAKDSYGVLVSAPVASWQNEAATERLKRLCQEAGITLWIPDVPASAVRRMGWQPVGTLLDLIAECVKVDGGILYEPRNGLALAFRPLNNLYSQTPALELDWDNGDVAAPLSPVSDDLHIRNDVTAKRVDGSSARSVQPAGRPLAAVPVEDGGVGVYDTQIDLNPADDANLVNLAGWYRRLGTVDEVRWPQVTVDLDASPGLVDDASAVDIGDLITIDNLPDDLSPDLVSLIVVGYSEMIGSHRRTITFNCVPAAPYNEVAVADGSKVVDAAGTERQSPGTIDATQTSITFTITDGEFWSTDAANFPVSCVMGGEVVTVNSIDAPVEDTQLFHVTRSENGVVRSHPAGTKIHVVDRAYVAL